mmetsp:Transcript_29571/g.68403  ORF Transcript_29571/g.68403 Transcript_29571/m.68403 type:complete len:213 (-) Transcript_29571:1180-1818(-)
MTPCNPVNLMGRTFVPDPRWVSSWYRSEPMPPRDPSRPWPRLPRVLCEPFGSALGSCSFPFRFDAVGLRERRRFVRRVHLRSIWIVGSSSRREPCLVPSWNARCLQWIRQQTSSPHRRYWRHGDSYWSPESCPRTWARYPRRLCRESRAFRPFPSACRHCLGLPGRQSFYPPRQRHNQIAVIAWTAHLSMLALLNRAILRCSMVMYLFLHLP